MQPRFPARRTEDWYQMLEERLITERVDNERQWRLIRQISGFLTGLEPVQLIVSVGLVVPALPEGSGSGE